MRTLANDQSQSRNWRPPLYPRPIALDLTLEQQTAAWQRARRRALYDQIRDLFRRPGSLSEDSFGGKMTLPPERSESETGCSLAPPFINWLETHELSDPTEHRRRRLLWNALDRLQLERPDLYLPLLGSARARSSPHRLSGGLAEALNLLLTWLAD